MVVVFWKDVLGKSNNSIEFVDKKVDINVFLSLLEDAIFIIEKSEV